MKEQLEPTNVALYMVGVIQSRFTELPAFETVRNICLRDDCISFKDAPCAPASGLL